MEPVQIHFYFSGSQESVVTTLKILFRYGSYCLRYRLVSTVSTLTLVYSIASVPWHFCFLKTVFLHIYAEDPALLL